MRRLFSRISWPTSGDSFARRAERPVRHGIARAVLAASLLGTLGLPFASAAPDTAEAAAAPSSVTSTIVARAAESSDGLIHLSLIPGASEARYIMMVRTLGQAPKAAACVTKDITGEIVMNPDGSVVPELSKLTLDQRTLKCQAPLRDNMAQQLLQTAEHPFAVFTAQSAPGLSLPIAPGAQAFQLVGDQTVRGVSRGTSYDLTGTIDPETFAGPARTQFKMTDFGITPPKIGPLVEVADEMTAEVTIQAIVSAPATAFAGGAPAMTDPAAAGDGTGAADAAP